MMLLLSSCAAGEAKSAGLQARGLPAPAGLAQQEQSRYTIRSGSLSLEVADLSAALERSQSLVQELGGHVEQRSQDDEEDTASLTLRVPRDRFQEAVESLSAVGTVESSSLSEADVSEEYIDVEAKVTNLRALRDRLRQLLERAKDVKDVIAVEEQLTKIQTELDRYEAQRKHLQGRIEMSTLHLQLTRRRIPGPLGLLLTGAAWVIEKLFVLY